ncbi:hypothetical protein ACFY3N_03090 [Streptomyces sp. NPDC000348]|uniref:hypothetical protein n=1 Tax=Streptomyces sp. NPDC000348 TaxID=3364538 RepID=UPI0036C3A2A2
MPLTGSPGAVLASYTRPAAERVRQRVVDVAEDSGTRSVILLHGAGLVARSWDAGGPSAGTPPAGGPADTPHGLWLLLPTEDPRATPVPDGRTVEVANRMPEWEISNGLFLKDLRSEAVRP